MSDHLKASPKVRLRFVPKLLHEIELRLAKGLADLQTGSQVLVEKNSLLSNVSSVGALSACIGVHRRIHFVVP